MAVKEKTDNKSVVRLRQLPVREGVVYIAYILLACMLTAEMNIIYHSYVLHIDLNAISFILSSITGSMFGYLLAKNKMIQDELKKIANTDPLTNIYNRLYFDSALTEEIKNIGDVKSVFSIIFFDLDHFKRINDVYGHLAGDEVLRKVSAAVAIECNATDVFARFGGEEFIIMLRATGVESASGYAEKLRKKIEDIKFDDVDKVTSSFGITEYIQQSDNRNLLLTRVDTALYKAKESGRNCVVIV